MNIVKRKSTHPAAWNDDLDNLFQGFFRPALQSDFFKKDHHMPAVDIDESDDHYSLMAELPGFDKDEIELSLKNGKLTINARHDQTTEEKQAGGSVLKERRYGSYFRSFDFGDNVAEQDVRADYENGVLAMTLPKRPTSEKKGQKIKIN